MGTHVKVIIPWVIPSCSRSCLLSNCNRVCVYWLLNPGCASGLLYLQYDVFDYARSSTPSVVSLLSLAARNVFGSFWCTVFFLGRQFYRVRVSAPDGSSP